MVITEKIERLNFVKKIVILVLSYILKLNRKITTCLAGDSEKILVISLHKIGDTLFTIPTIRYLFENNKNKLYVLCFENNAILFKKFVSAEINVITLKEDNFCFKNRFIKLNAIKKIKLNLYNEIIDLTGAINSTSILFFLNSNKKIGLTNRYFKEAYSKSIIKNENIHLIKMYFEVMTLIDKNAELEKYLKYPVNNKQITNIAINPFGGWLAKEWNLEKFVQMGKRLNEKYDITFIIDANRMNDFTKDSLNLSKCNIIISNSIEDLINTLSKFTLFIGNDSGPLYIAAMLGIPTFSIYGPTNPKFSLPLDGHHSFIQKIINCSPSENKQYCNTYGGQIGCNNFECMNQLSLDEVVSCIENFIYKFKVLN